MGEEKPGKRVWEKGGENRERESKGVREEDRTREEGARKNGGG